MERVQNVAGEREDDGGDDKDRRNERDGKAVAEQTTKRHASALGGRGCGAKTPRESEHMYSCSTGPHGRHASSSFQVAPGCGDQLIFLARKSHTKYNGTSNVRTLHDHTI